MPSWLPKDIKERTGQSRADPGHCPLLLAEVRDESRITLYLPEGVQRTEDEALKLADGDSSGGIQLVVKHDPTLSLGDVRIETAWGWIDGRASVRWQRLVEALRRGIDDDGDD